MIDISTEVLVSIVAATIALLGGLSFYFGKMINLFSTEKIENNVYRIGGAFFLLLFVFPMIFIYYLILRPHLLFFLDNTLFFMLLPLLIDFPILIWLANRIHHLSINGNYFFENQQARRGRLVSFSVIGLIVLSWFPMLYVVYNLDYIFILISNSPSPISLELSVIIAYLAISVIYAFAFLTLIAIAYGFFYAVYYRATIFYEEGSHVRHLTGRIVKSNNQYVKLIVNTSGYVINKDKIIRIVFLD